ncbi:MAG: MerR family transcriptional regulator [Saccharofermentans sp.]|nr:MerR family transcriptional regulator [Saccharofermentans sp.]
MSKYTTGELAKLCGVTVRTVQYYDTRGILIPSELTEGGRRLYSEDDLKLMKIICFLRDLDLPIDAISQILKEEHPEKVISLLIEQQENALEEDISEKKEKLDKLHDLKSGLKKQEIFSLESIGDIAVIMKDKKKLKKLRMTMILTGIPVTTLQWFSIIFWIIKGIWWPFVLWVIVATVWGITVSKYYFNSVKYICPECHEVFKPAIKEAFFANHTPTTRKLTCTSCGHKGFCVEVWGGKDKSKAE